MLPATPNKSFSFVLHSSICNSTKYPQRELPPRALNLIPPSPSPPSTSRGDSSSPRTANPIRQSHYHSLPFISTSLSRGTCSITSDSHGQSTSQADSRLAMEIKSSREGPKLLPLPLASSFSSSSSPRRRNSHLSFHVFFESVVFYFFFLTFFLFFFFYFFFLSFLFVFFVYFSTL